eukprot:g710.t1
MTTSSSGHDPLAFPDETEIGRGSPLRLIASSLDDNFDIVANSESTKETILDTWLDKDNAQTFTDMNEPLYVDQHRHMVRQARQIQRERRMHLRAGPSHTPSEGVGGELQGSPAAQTQDLKNNSHSRAPRRGQFQQIQEDDVGEIVASRAEAFHASRRRKRSAPDAFHTIETCQERSRNKLCSYDDSSCAFRAWKRPTSSAVQTTQMLASGEQIEAARILKKYADVLPFTVSIATHPTDEVFIYIGELFGNEGEISAKARRGASRSSQSLQKRPAGFAVDIVLRDKFGRRVTYLDVKTAYLTLVRARLVATYCGKDAKAAVPSNIPNRYFQKMKDKEAISHGDGLYIPTIVDDAGLEVVPMRSPDVVEYHHDGSRRTKSRAMKIFRVKSTCSDYPHKKGSTYSFLAADEADGKSSVVRSPTLESAIFSNGILSLRCFIFAATPQDVEYRIHFSVEGIGSVLFAPACTSCTTSPFKVRVWNSRKTVSSSTDASLGLLRRNLKLHLRHKEKSLKDVRFFSFPLQTSTLRCPAQPHLICASEHASMTEPPPSTRTPLSWEGGLPGSLSLLSSARMRARMENNHASNAALAYSKYSSQRHQKEKADGTPVSTTVIISHVGEAFSKLMKVDVELVDAAGKACNVQHWRKKRRVWTLNATIEVDPPQSLRVPGTPEPLISIHGPQIFRNSSASLLLHFASGLSDSCTSTTNLLPGTKFRVVCAVRDGNGVLAAKVGKSREMNVPICAPHIERNVIDEINEDIITDAEACISLCELSKGGARPDAAATSGSGQVKLPIQYSQSELDALAKSIDGRIDSTLLEDVMKVPPSADIMERVNLYVLKTVAGQDDDEWPKIEHVVSEVPPLHSGFSIELELSGNLIRYPHPMRPTATPWEPACQPLWIDTVANVSEDCAPSAYSPLAVQQPYDDDEFSRITRQGPSKTRGANLVRCGDCGNVKAAGKMCPFTSIYNHGGGGGQVDIPLGALLIYAHSRRDAMQKLRAQALWLFRNVGKNYTGKKKAIESPSFSEAALHNAVTSKPSRDVSQDWSVTPSFYYKLLRRSNPGQLNVYKCHPASVLFEPSEQMYIVQASIGSGQLALPRMRGAVWKIVRGATN